MSHEAILRPRAETRPFKVLATHHNGHGQSLADLVCPFCSHIFTVHIWALADTGEDCPKCDAWHGCSGEATKTITERVNA